MSCGVQTVRMVGDRSKPLNVKEACLREARAIAAREGIEHLSLRDVARRLSISHQAPYRHFKSRDHLLAELVARAFHDFASSLSQAADLPDADRALAAMGVAYLDYAARDPLSYRLMFGTSLPPASDHPEMMAEARHAFDLLKTALRRRHAARSAREDYREHACERDAMFVWSSLHGFASIHASSAFETLTLDRAETQTMIEHLFMRIGAGLEAPA